MTPIEQKEETYNKILQMFDVIEKMIVSIENPAAKNNHVQLEVAEQFIRNATESLEIILEAYIAHIKRGDAPSAEDCRAIEDAARKIFLEIGQFVRLAQRLKQAA